MMVWIVTALVVSMIVLLMMILDLYDQVAHAHHLIEMQGEEMVRLEEKIKSLSKS